MSVDLHQVFARLAPGVSYRLDSAVPPHKLLEWRGKNDPPTEIEIEACWNAIELEPKLEKLPSLREIYTRLKAVESEVSKS